MQEAAEEAAYTPPAFMIESVKEALEVVNDTAEAFVDGFGGAAVTVGEAAADVVGDVVGDVEEKVEECESESRILYFLPLPCLLFRCSLCALACLACCAASCLARLAICCSLSSSSSSVSTRAVRPSPSLRNVCLPTVVALSCSSRGTACRERRSTSTSAGSRGRSSTVTWVGEGHIRT